MSNLFWSILKRVGVDGPKELAKAQRANLNGMELIDDGSSRIAFRTPSSRGRMVLKLAKENSHNGRLDNQKEIETWRSVQGTAYEDYFARIVEYDAQNYEYILMEEVPNIPATRSTVEDMWDIANTLQGMTTDLSAENIGERNGHPVVVDYPWGKVGVPSKPPEEAIND